MYLTLTKQNLHKVVGFFFTKKHILDTLSEYIDGLTPLNRSKIQPRFSGIIVITWTRFKQTNKNLTVVMPTSIRTHVFNNRESEKNDCKYSQHYENFVEMKLCLEKNRVLYHFLKVNIRYICIVFISLRYDNRQFCIN